MKLPVILCSRIDRFFCRNALKPYKLDLLVNMISEIMLISIEFIRVIILIENFII